MTAEIAILNRQAVALAADSAVTVGVWAEGQPREKIFVANKVFSLSKYEPVGIMIYGSASFMGMPWETVIKDYRRRLGKRTFAHLPEYATAFLEHLRDAPHLATEQDEDEHIRIILRGYFLAAVVEQIAAEVQKATPPADDEQVEQIAEQVIQKKHEAWRKAPFVMGATDASVERMRNRVRTHVNQLRGEVFERIPVSDRSLGLLEELAAFLLVKGNFPRPGDCGIVIAGFGENDLYPRLRAYSVHGRVGGVLHAVERRQVDIGVELDAIIIPFAQREVVDTFLGGVEPLYQGKVEDDFAKTIQELPQIILDQVEGLTADKKAALEHKITEITKQKFTDYQSKLAEYRNDRFSNPIIEMVVALPKEELASMAESLVSLTSLRRRVSVESETVGGPIDVAIISKGDGLIWIKRKHYFKPELNQHFFATYFKDPLDAAS